MPQFLVLADDFNDPDALQRRLGVRKQHLARMKEEKGKGHFISGGAKLNDAGQMYGSMLVIELPDINAANEWIRQDPYITGRVWDKVQVVPFRIADV